MLKICIHFLPFCFIQQQKNLPMHESLSVWEFIVAKNSSNVCAKKRGSSIDQTAPVTENGKD